MQGSVRYVRLKFVNFYLWGFQTYSMLLIFLKGGLRLQYSQLNVRRRKDGLLLKNSGKGVLLSGYFAFNAPSYA